jgi:hypothetical protein
MASALIHEAFFVFAAVDTRAAEAAKFAYCVFLKVCERAALLSGPEPPAWAEPLLAQLLALTTDTSAARDEGIAMCMDALGKVQSERDANRVAFETMGVTLREDLRRMMAYDYTPEEIESAARTFPKYGAADCPGWLKPLPFQFGTPADITDFVARDCRLPHADIFAALAPIICRTRVVL